jgi:hypothetical protein
MKKIFLLLFLTISLRLFSQIQEYITTTTPFFPSVEFAKINRNTTYLFGATSGIETNLYKFIFGNNIVRFLKELKDWQSARTGATCPKIIMIGDSYLNNTWPEDVMTYLHTHYNFTVTNLTKYNYGGQSIEDMLPQIEDCIIKPNADLVIFCEYEGAGTNDKYLHEIENIIQLLRERTSSDVMISTWGLDKTNLTSIVNNQTTLPTNTAFETFNWYRDIAKIYNCELVDMNWAVIQYGIAHPTTAEINAIYTDDTHLNATGEAAIYVPELEKHFNTPIWVENSNVSYSWRNKEEVVYFSEQLRFKDMVKGNIVYNNEANWSIVDNTVKSKTTNAYIIVDANDCIGFELVYLNTTGNVVITVSEDSGSTYVAPSTLTFNGKPLQYCTPGYSSNAYCPTKHIILKNNILPNGTLESGNYNIKITNVSGSDYTVTVYNPALASMGTYLVGKTELSTTDLDFNLSWNGCNNYTSTAFVLNTNYYFKVKSNWIDTVNTATGSTARVVGMGRADYKVKLKLSTDSCILIGLKIYH